MASNESLRPESLADGRAPALKHHRSDLKSARGLWECLLSLRASLHVSPSGPVAAHALTLLITACNVCMEQALMNTECFYINERLCVFAVGTDTENEDNCV